MIYAFGAIALLLIVFGPQLWVRWVMRAHADEIPGMPGTGGELAEHLVEAHGLDGVKVELTEMGDHYDPGEKAVRLSEANYHGKSLTAIAVATHEVGHALQDFENDPRMRSREQLVPLANQIARWSTMALWAAPVIGLLARHPVPISMMVLIGISGLVARMLVHLVTLPIEWDASFGKALPVLEKGQYVAPEEIPTIRRILRAAAFTYVAAALADILNLARWAMILIRR